MDTPEGQILFPIAKDRMIPFSDTLVKQAIYGTQVASEFRNKTLGLDNLITDVQSLAKAGQLRVPSLDHQLHHDHDQLLIYFSSLKGAIYEAAKIIRNRNIFDINHC